VSEEAAIWSAASDCLALEGKTELARQAARARPSSRPGAGASGAGSPGRDLLAGCGKFAELYGGFLEKNDLIGIGRLQAYCEEKFKSSCPQLMEWLMSRK
jgi:hypothetical protein